MKNIISVLLAISALTTANTANAASTYTWTGASSSNWDTTTSGNWSPAGNPGSADTVIFNTLAPTGTISIGTVAISNIQFGAATGAAAKTFTLGATVGTGTIDITNNAGTFLSYLGGSTNTANQTVNSNIVLGSGTDTSTYTIMNAASGALVVKGTISSGSSGVQTLNVTSTAGGKINLSAISGNEAVGLSAGTGTITLLAANSYTGGTTISSGTVVDNAAAAFGANGSSVALNGGTLDIFLAGATNTFNVTVGGNATIVSDRSSAGAGIGYVLGSLNIGASQLTVSGGATNVTSGTSRIIFGSSTANSTLTDNGGTTEFTSSSAAFVIGGILFGSATGSNVDTLTLDGAYDGGGASGTASKLTGLAEDGAGGGKLAIVKNGSGSWALYNNTTNAANYTGGTTVNAGTLYLAGTAGMGSANAAVTLNGGTLDYFLGSSASNLYNYTVGTGGTGTPTIASDSTTGVGFTYTLGTLSIGANTLNITKGTGVTSGTSGISFGAVTLTAATGTTTLNPTTAALTVASVSGSASTGNTDTLDLDGTSGSSSVTGVIADGSGGGKVALTKSNASTWTVGAANTFTGPTSINAGTLNISAVAAAGAAQSLGKGSVVNLGVASTSSGVLNYTGGTGTLSGMTINVLGNGSDAVVNSGAGTLTLADSIVKNGTTFSVTGKVNIAGVISGSSTNSDMDYNGATSTVSVAGTYNGPTRIFNGSTVTNGVNDALADTTGGASANTAITLGDSSETANQTNIYALGGFSQTVGGLTAMSGAGHTDTNAVIGGAAAASTLNVNVASGSDTYSGLLGNGVSGANSANNLALVKSGLGSLTETSDNTYTAGTTVSGGTFYINNAGGASYSAPSTSANRTIAPTNSTGSGTGTGAVTVQSTGTLAGAGTIASTGGGIEVKSGGTLSSGGVQSGTSAGQGLTINNSANLSSALLVDGGASLTFALGSTTAYNAGSGALNFANPNTNSSYLSLSGTTTDVIFANTSTMDNINLVDLTSAVAPGGVSLTLRAQNPYLLIQTGLGNNADFSNIWTTGGEGANGYVLGVSDGSATGYTQFNINAFALNGTSPINTATNLEGLQLYLYNGDLEVVPEPGTWALMIGGLSLLIIIQRRRKV